MALAVLFFRDKINQQHESQSQSHDDPMNERSESLDFVVLAIRRLRSLLARGSRRSLGRLRARTACNGSEPSLVSRACAGGGRVGTGRQAHPLERRQLRCRARARARLSTSCVRGTAANPTARIEREALGSREGQPAACRRHALKWYRGFK